jgi:uncharacterized protein DUF3592
MARAPAPDQRRAALSSTAFVIGLFCIAFGAVFAVIGIAIAVSGARFRRGARRVQGTVTGLRAVASRTDPSTGPVGGTTGPHYRPVVKFTTLDGREVEAESMLAANPAPARVGDTVRVFYDPGDPRRIQLDTAGGRGGCLAFALIFVGAVFCAIGAVVLVAAG